VDSFKLTAIRRQLLEVSALSYRYRHIVYAILLAMPGPLILDDTSVLVFRIRVLLTDSCDSMGAAFLGVVVAAS
jgi:hypothetical protein